MIHYLVNDMHTYIKVLPINVYRFQLNKNAWTNPISYKDKCIAMHFPVASTLMIYKCVQYIAQKVVSLHLIAMICDL